MSNEGLTAAIRSWASARGKLPFTVSECYESLPETDDVKEVADRVRSLYLRGYLARKTNEGSRYQYVWHAFASAGFEMAPVQGKPRKDKAARLADAAPAIAATGFREEPALEIPEFLRKFPDPALEQKNDHDLGTSQVAQNLAEARERQGGFDSAAIADTLLARLGEMLAAQRRLIEARIDNAAASSVETSPGSRLTVKIERVEITVEGL